MLYRVVVRRNSQVVWFLYSHQFVPPKLEQQLSKAPPLGAVSLTSLEKRLEWQTAGQRLDERLTQWREEFVAAVFRLINTE